MTSIEEWWDNGQQNDLAKIVADLQNRNYHKSTIQVKINLQVIEGEGDSTV